MKLPLKNQNDEHEDPRLVKSGGVFIKSRSCLDQDQFVYFHLSQTGASYPHQIGQNRKYRYFLLNDGLSLI